MFYNECVVFCKLLILRKLKNYLSFCHKLATDSKVTKLHFLSKYGSIYRMAYLYVQIYEYLLQKIASSLQIPLYL